VNSPEVNIMTIEDPVEYKLQNMAQVGVNPKIHLDLATGLRHILRQDPDIIMIGEIRDKETAEIAIQASLTGHLVLSTLHTNDAPSALTRLVEMGTEAYLLSSTVVGVLAQRLVRTICPHCKESYLPTELECKELGLDSIQPFYRGRGCDQCFDLGYKGRHGIYELMAMNHAVKQQILKSADAVELREVALEHGMVPLRINGAQLVLRGITTSSEVLRVTRGYEGE
jgi:general secretion pathway protein E